MEKISAKSFFWFWVLLGFASMLLIWFLPWRFQTNDDELMMWLVSGAYTGETESYAVFIHPLLSWVFSKLYTLFPEIRWYPLAWFSVLYLSYVSLLKIIFDRRASFATAHVLVVVLFCLVVHFAFFLQFTIVAGFASLAGFSFLLRKENNSDLFINNILPFIGLLIAMCIRVEAVILVGLGFLAYYSVVDFQVLKNRFPSVLLLGILIGGSIVTKSLVEKSASYANFVEFNKARAAVSDHPVTFRLEFEEKMNPSSKWFYFSQWMMEDERITIAELKERKDLLDLELLTFDQVLSSFSRLASILRVESFKSFFLIFVVIYFLYAEKYQVKKLLFLAVWLSFFLVFNHFNVLNGRVIILFIFPLLGSVFSGQEVLSRKLSFLLIFAFVIVLLVHVVNILEQARGRELMKEEFLALQKTIPDKSLMILEGYKENFLAIDYSLTQQVPFISLGWISKSPFQQKALDKLGLRSIADANSFYLFGVDVHEEFFFIDYMNFESNQFELHERKVLDNWILFHYKKNPKND